MTKPNTDLHFRRMGKKDFALQCVLNQQKLTSDLRSRYDFIVRGAGTSGCVVAARLAADPISPCSCLEAGGTDETDLITNPNHYGSVIPTSDMRS